MSAQNVLQTAGGALVVVFQGKPNDSREYRILLDGDELVYEEAKSWDRLGVPRFVETDDGYQALKAFITSYSEGQKEQGLADGSIAVVWQGNHKNVEYRVLALDGELIFEEAKIKDRLGVPQFVDAQDEEAVLEAFAFAVGHAKQASQPTHDKAASHGWHCDQSLDHVCHYFSDERQDDFRVVVMSDGSELPLPVRHDHHSESEDQCIFCGQPQERK